MRLRDYIFILALMSGGLFADGPIVELIQPQNEGWVVYGDDEYADDSGSVIIRKWNSCNCTSDIFQTIQLRIHDADGIDWPSFRLAVVTFGGAISYNGLRALWWSYGGEPFSDSIDVARLAWAAYQDFTLEIDSVLGIVTITPLGRGIRPDFVCADSCLYSPYTGPCCVNIGDVNSPGFGHTSAPYWGSLIPTRIEFMIRDLIGDYASSPLRYFCVDYSGPSASTPRPADGSTVDTLHPVIGITILDTIWVRHSAYPNPIDPYFPHCPCYDSLCTDSTGAFLEFPYCGDKFIEWNTIDTTSIRLSVNGAVYSLDSPGMSWFDDSLLLFDTGEAGLSFADGDTVRVCLEEATDRVSQGHGPNHLGRHADWTHPDTPSPFCWEFYVDVTGIADESAKPEMSSIKSIVPNPFNSIVSIKYSVGGESHIDLSVYDILGRKVATLLNERKPAGSYDINWDASDMPSGAYFIRFIVNDEPQTAKVTLLR